MTLTDKLKNLSRGLKEQYLTQKQELKDEGLEHERTFDGSHGSRRMKS
ncbi:MAG: hypothetical protein ACLU9T_16090 [Blautia faecis]